MFDKSERRKVCGKFHIDFVFVFPPSSIHQTENFCVFPSTTIAFYHFLESEAKSRGEKKLHSQIN
jgi:hypothetical protein